MTYAPFSYSEDAYENVAITVVRKVQKVCQDAPKKVPPEQKFRVVNVIRNAPPRRFGLG